MWSTTLLAVAFWSQSLERPQIELVGDARVEGQTIRLTGPLENQRGAIWRRQKLAVRGGFETTFQFRISETGGLRNGADGFAFVIQNNGPQEIAGKGSSGGFGFGDGLHDKTKPAIANSLAIFFDTHLNYEEDLSGNSISICTNGNRKQMRWPPPRLGVNWNPSVKLKDGLPHDVRISFKPPMMTVFVDGSVAVRAPVDLARMVSADGTAYAGFTASTGLGWENHDILAWHFEPAVSSDAYSVSSNISFAQFECLPAKSLCTPGKAIVELLSPGKWHVILPAHVAWAGAIPNPQAAQVRILDARGTACWDPAAGECGSPEMAPTGTTGALQWRHKKGRTEFTLQDKNYSDNQGYFEFEVELIQ